MTLDSIAYYTGTLLKGQLGKITQKLKLDVDCTDSLNEESLQPVDRICKT